MRRIWLVAVFAWAALSATHVTATPIELVQNGGFETGDFTDWTVSDNVNDFVINEPSFVNSGMYGAALGSPLPVATLDQSIPTVVGSTYDFSFYLEHVQLSSTADTCTSGDPSCTPIDNSFSASFGTDNVLPAFTADDENSCSAASCFAKYDFGGIVATSSVTDVNFTFFDGPDAWGLDDVSVLGPALSSVPEPSSALLLLAGLGSVLLLRYRTRSQRSVSELRGGSCGPTVDGG
jgi:hypothetical protein